jgi:hypothetical protein
MEKKMRRTIVILGLLVLSCTFTPELAAGEMDDYMELLQADLRASRVAVLTEDMGLDEGEAAIFWPLHREYELERSGIQDRRVALLKEFGAHLSDMNDDKAGELLSAARKLDADRQRALDRVLKKMHRSLSSGVVCGIFGGATAWFGGLRDA